MDTFMKLLSAHSTLAWVLGAVIVVVVLLFAAIMFIAFRQGREVSIWPPKVGKKPENPQKSYVQEASVSSTSDEHHTKSSFMTADELGTIAPMSDLIKRSEDIMMAGVALGQAVQRHMSQLTKALENGARLRFMVLDPTSPDICEVARTVEVSPDRVKGDIQITLRDLDVLKGKAKALRSGSVEVRLLRREPSLSFLVCDPKTPHGCLFAGLRCYGHRSTTRPHFHVASADQWFQPLVASCECLWTDSHVWSSEHEQTARISVKAGVVAYRIGGLGEIEVLLITARTDPGRWIFPVGGVDTNETIQQAAARECAEESGYIAEIGVQLGAIEVHEGPELKRMLFFAASIAGELRDYETDRQRRWVPLSRLTTIVAEDFLPIAHIAEATLSC